MASMSAFGPVPGLAVYAATKHAVLGFTGSLQGDLFDAGIPITVHALCPDAADTPLLREHDHEPASAIIWSAPRMLTRGGGRRAAVALLDSKRWCACVPRWRGWPRAPRRWPAARRCTRAGPPQAGRAPAVALEVTDEHMTATRPQPPTQPQTIDVENPATGQDDRQRRRRARPTGPRAGRARAVAPAGWEALGFEGRAQSSSAARSG